MCATVHSPTPYTFTLFDRVLMLLRGRVIYFGLNGASMIHHFSALRPNTEAVNQKKNPADWIVDITTEVRRVGWGMVCCYFNMAVALAWG